MDASRPFQSLGSEWPFFLGEFPVISAAREASLLEDNCCNNSNNCYRPFEYDVIAYPFLHESWQQTRFSDGSRYGVAWLEI